jgi:hypothetical protein
VRDGVQARRGGGGTPARSVAWSAATGQVSRGCCTSLTALPGADIFDTSDVILMERRPIRSGRQVLRFVTDRKPTYAGIDPYNFYIDRNSADNVMAVK